MSSSNSDLNYSLTENNRTYTKVEQDTATHTWTIDNFNFLEAEGGHVKSLPFSAPTNNKIAWHLLLIPNGHLEDTLSISLFLDQSSKVEKVFANFNFWFSNDRKTKQSAKSTQVRQYVRGSRSDGKIFHLGYSFTKDEDFRKNLLCNNRLTIHCEVIFSHVRDVVVNCRREIPLMSNVHESDLSENFASLLKTQAFSDVVISTNGKDFPAHKLILAARSNVFAAMFHHDMKENQVNRVDIEDVKEEVVGEMLKYIYTGKCENLDSLAEDLLAAADKYDLDRLKTTCAEVLIKTMSVENAANILMLAELHDVDVLKSEAIKFIADRFDEVIKSEGWKNVLPNSQLMNKVCLALYHR